MYIERVLAVAGLNGYYCDDLAAIRGDAPRDGLLYVGEPRTRGFRAIREVGECISIILVLDSGMVAFGDAVTVQYAAAARRDGILRAGEELDHVERELKRLLLGQHPAPFRQLCSVLNRQDGTQLHTAVRYGTSQALLHAAALAQAKTMAELIAEEFGTPLARKPVPVFAQTGDDRYQSVDKMILKRVDELPHGLFNSPQALGQDGENLLSYASWIRARLDKLAGDTYRPVFHFDVYGLLADILGGDIQRVADLLQALEQAIAPCAVRVEAPLYATTRDGVIDRMSELRREMRRRGSRVDLVADEWCNTLEDIKAFVDGQAADMIHIKTPDLGTIDQVVEAVKYCKEHGTLAYVGGSCTGTDQSSRITAHIALGTSADLVLSQMGMGVDEGVMVLRNEMARTLALLEVGLR